jgi:hypothetical protein
VRALPDGGQLLVVLPNRRLRECFELRGPVAEACSLVVDGGEAGDEEAPLQAVVDRCSCRARGALCRWRGAPDGGMVDMSFGNIHHGPVAGAGCRRAACGVFQGEDDSTALHGDCL